MNSMNALKFYSDILLRGNRYSKNFSLPDYIRDENGKFSREKTLQRILEEEYGYVESANTHMDVELISEAAFLWGGKCKRSIFCFTLKKEQESSSFTVNLLQPQLYAGQDIPLIVFMNSTNDVPNRNLPGEELMDLGVAIAQFNYDDIANDYLGDTALDNFSGGCARLLVNREKQYAAGKIAIWAYIAGQVGKYMLREGYVKAGNLYVAGQSRLGKTALLTAATNEEFSGCLSNCSGCCGAAISREKHGESIEKINELAAYWFTPSFVKYNNRENEMPFDQHYLLACIAPRKICIVTAENDTWADTDAQYLCAEAASVVYEEMGVVGLDKTNGELQTGFGTTKGNIAFSKRFGEHFLSRADWKFFIDFIKGND